ncbi:MAG TPA: hypothetical protein VNS63_02710 [Blastocatellia bacterium]|nr:hypothetical protein [Blastocatellia bacterium]
MPTCFFIRPFVAARAGNEDPAVFDTVCRAVEAAAEHAGVRLIDPAADQRAGVIMDQVRAGIDDADVIVALVTGENPNVFYELGWARREAIILVRSGDNIPFDIRGHRYWAYGGLSHSELLAQLSEAIEQTLHKVPATRQERLKNQIEHFFATPLPKVNEANVFDLLGVWRSPEAPVGRPDPPYVARDCDAGLERVIASAKFTLVHGPAKAGKSRSAAQALRSVARDCSLLVPRPGRSDSLAAFTRLALTVAADAPELSFVLWLDDLDNYLKASALEHSDIQRLVSCDTLSLVATIRTPALDALRAADDERARLAQLLLARAELVEVPGVLSESERLLAENCYPDLPLGPSLGESFVAAPQLRARLDAVDLGAVASVAIARAAIDIQRLGVLRSIKPDELRTLHRAYVIHLDPQSIYEATAFDQGLREVLEPIARHSALLLRDTSEWKEDRFFVQDFLVEHVETRGDAILPAVWSWAVDRLDSGSTAWSLADEAGRRHEDEWRTEALRKGGEFNHGLCLFRLGLAAEKSEDSQAAERYLRRAADVGLRRAPLALAGLYRNIGRTKNAIDVLEQEAGTGSLRAAVLLCSYFDADGRPADYERTCRQAIKSGSAWHAHELGRRLAQQKATDEARAIWSEGIDLCIANFDRELGDLSDFGADFATRADEALGLMEEDQFRGNLDLAFRLARSLEGIGATNGAERAYRFLHARGSVVGSLHLAALLWNEGKREEAGTLARDLAADPTIIERLSSGEVVPRSQPKLNGLTVLTLPNRNQEVIQSTLLFAGQVLSRLGQREVALALWQAGADRSSAECAWELAQFSAEEGSADYETALRRAAALGSARATWTLGVLLLEKGDHERAEALLRQASQSDDPEVVVNVRLHLGTFYHRQRRLEDAENEYRWIVENAREDATAAKAAANLGIMLEHFTGRFNDAADAYFEAIDRGDVNCADECRQRLADLYERLFPALANEDGNGLLSLASKLNVREIATPRVLAGIVLGNALVGKFDTGRSVLNQLEGLEPSRLNEVKMILESEVAADSVAGRALQAMRESGEPHAERS